MPLDFSVKTHNMTQKIYIFVKKIFSEVLQNLYQLETI